MNPHTRQSFSFTALMQTLWRHQQLTYQMARREVVGRYKGSMLGLAWSFFTPILMLAVYTYVFSVIFKSKWGGNEHQSQTDYAMLLFTGMIIMNFFNDVINRAPQLILSNTNYVKKVVFPIEILPVISIYAALFHGLVSLVVLQLACIVFNHPIQWTLVFLPLILLPLVLLTAGFAWFLASLGVFLRDLGQTIAILTTMLTFLSPVFYPISAVPESFRVFMLMNPLTVIIEQAREVIIYGHVPDWSEWSISLATSVILAWVGFAWFQKTRQGFADVL